MQRRFVISSVLFTLCALGCRTTTPSPPPARVTLSAAPSTIVPTVCPVASCGAGSDDVEAITTITLRETAGGNGTLDGFTVVLRRNSDNATLLNTTVGIGAGTRISANQSVNVPFAVHFARGQAGSAMTMTVTANGRNDGNDATVTATMTIAVSAFPG